MKKMKREGLIEDIPLNGFVSAVSVGIVENEKLLDLCYAEDSKAMVDMNVVMTDRGEYIEIQGTGEDRPFCREELNELLFLADEGCRQLHQIQKTNNRRDSDDMKTIIAASSNAHKIKEKFRLSWINSE